MSFLAIAAGVSAAATVAGTVMSIQGQKNAAKAGEYAAEFNADQARKQAKYNEGIAQENMRRQRDNNRREIARRRATAARSGLAETGAVADSLIETGDRLQQDIDDIWERASKNSEMLENKASMGLWESRQATSASKYNIWGTALSGAAQTASLGYQAYQASGVGGPTPNPNQIAPLKALPPR